MVVLAASIVTKTGKALVSRQYMDMSRIRIEGLLAAFPKLVGSGKQHTYVETENVRYVFQPMEGLYLLLVTNRNSNILEDLDTLRLLSKLVPEYSGVMLDEESVARAAFDLIFAFDEVISNGHKENITVQQVKQNCEMESHEEKLHKMIIQSKINDTKDLMKKKALEIEKQREVTKRSAPALATGGSASFGGLSAGSGSASRSDLDAGPNLSQPGLSGLGAAAAPERAAPPSGRRGMVLGKKAGTSSLLETLAKEEGVTDLDVPLAVVKSAVAGGGTIIISEPVYLTIEEKLSVMLNHQGGMELFEVQGTLSLVVSEPDESCVSVAITQGANRGYQFKTHPNIDKAAFANNVLQLKDPSRPFPTGSELGVLKWRYTSRDEALVPLTITCWPSASGPDMYVNLEYESTVGYDLRNVEVAVPLPGSGAPTVNQCDGEWRYDSRNHLLLWTVELIDDTNRSGALEFVVPACDPESFYPMEVAFTSPHAFCEVTVETVTNTRTGAPVKYGHKRALLASGYQIV